MSAQFPELYPGASLHLTLTAYLKGLFHFTSSFHFCISSNNEYHTSFAATPDYDHYATHRASEHVPEACSGDFFPAASHVKILATTTPQVSSWITTVLNPSSEKSICLLNNSTVQPQPISLFLSKRSSFHCGAIWATVFLLCFFQLLLLTYFHNELVLILVINEKR